jgi:hypothetical protein
MMSQGQATFVLFKCIALYTLPSAADLAWL